MPIGITIALPIEWGYLGRAFHGHQKGSLGGRRHYTGRFGDIPVSVIVGGVGKQNAGRAARLLCETHPPSVMLSIGYAGALSPELKRGDIVLSSYSLNEEPLGPSETDLAIERKLRTAAEASHEHHVYVGPLYTAERIVAQHEEKCQIFERTGAPVVDMESFAVYREARAHGIPFVGVHTITDTSEEDIPALGIITPFLMSDSLWRYPKIFWDLLCHPRFLVDMNVLNHDAKLAGHSLAHYLVSNARPLGNLLTDLRTESTTR